MVKDLYSEVQGLVVDRIEKNEQLVPAAEAEYEVFWFDPPGPTKLKYVRSWRKARELELISEGR